VYKDRFYIHADRVIEVRDGERKPWQEYIGLEVHHHEFLSEEYRPVIAAVFSDGVKSFVDEQRQEVSTLEVIRSLMNFKGFKGEFVKRRMQGFLKSARKRGWKHDDDLSMAAIYLGK
jgi:hypothetical protein